MIYCSKPIVLSRLKIRRAIKEAYLNKLQETKSKELKNYGPITNFKCLCLYVRFLNFIQQDFLFLCCNCPLFSPLFSNFTWITETQKTWNVVELKLDIDVKNTNLEALGYSLTTCNDTTISLRPRQDTACLMRSS